MEEKKEELVEKKELKAEAEAKTEEAEIETGAEEEPEVEAKVEDVTETETRPAPEEAPSGGKRRKIKSRRIRRRNKKMIILLIFAVIAAAVVTINLPVFDVENLSVIGNKRVEDAEVKRLSEMEDGKSLFGLNSMLASYKVGLNAYMKDVKVKRKPPSTMEIIVTERVPIAQVATAEQKNKKRKYVAVDETGRVLEISEKKMDVSYIKDVDVTSAKLKDKVIIKQAGPYEKAMEILKTADENDMFFMRISMKGSMVEACIYGDLYCRGRYNNLMSALKKGTLKTVVYRLYQNNVSKGTINVGDNNYCSFTTKT